MPTKVTLINRWRGFVAHVDQFGKSFSANLTNTAQPLELRMGVLFDVEDVSPKEQHMLKPGAKFIWTTAFEVTPGGQRNRVSTICFADKA